MDDLNLIGTEIDRVTVSDCFVCSPENSSNYLKPENSLKVLHVNIRSINCNFDNLLVLISRLSFTLDVILLSECWLSKCPNIPLLAGYKTQHTSFGNQNDGVVAYVRGDLQCSFETPVFNDANCLVIKFSDKIALIALYRSPSFKDLTPFFSSLDLLLHQLAKYKTIALIGDTNINISPSTLDLNSEEYLNISASHAMLPAHTFPTRLANCLDHVLLKSPRIATTLVLDFCVTDHAPVLLFCNRNGIANAPKRSREKTDITKVIEDINSSDLSQILQLNDPNLAAQSLVSLLSSSVNLHSYSTIISSRKRIIKPWITPGLLRCIRHRDKLYNKTKKFPDNDTHKLIFKRYRNYCNNLLKTLKRDFEISEFRKAKNNPKATWKLIKQIANLDKGVSTSSELLKCDNTPLGSVNKLNHYFANVGSNLASAISQPTPQANVTNNNPNPGIVKPSFVQAPLDSMVMYPVDDLEIENIIHNLKDKCAVGYDGIPASVVKATKNSITPILVHIFNLCLSAGIFPDVFKTAIVHPIYKGGVRDAVSNYRPISVLTTLSKIFEKAINVRLVKYLTKLDILGSNQFGFRAGKSTDDAILELSNTIVEHLNHKQKSMAVFLDLSKAFDTVSVPRLIDKLEEIGIRGNALDMFRSYLTGRKQVVQVETFISREENVSFGVPQGSVLGPTLFLIYVNELCLLSLPNTKIITYADDTALITHGKDWSETRDRAEEALRMVMKWLTANLLTLNVSKTKFIPFTQGILSQPPSSFEIRAHVCCHTISTCNCAQIERTDSIKYLGVIVDSLLTWKKQVNSTVTRVRRLIYLFKNLRASADFQCLIMVYFALAQSVLAYCITSWGGTHKTTMLRLERAQRSVLKVLAKKPIRFPTCDLYSLCKVLTVRQLFILHTVLKKHNLLHYDPQFITRKRRTDRICKAQLCRSAVIGRHFNYISPKLYNNINKKISIYSLTRNSLRKKLSELLKSMSYDETELLMVT